MKLFEVDAKRLLEKFSIAVPKSQLARNSQEMRDAINVIGLPAMLKAQVKSGKRQKAGLVVDLASTETLRMAKDFMRRVMSSEEGCAGVLIESKIDLSRELYFLLDVDDLSGDIRCWTSLAGGVNVEEHQAADTLHMARITHEEQDVNSVIRESLDPRLASADAAAVADVGGRLVAAMRDTDAELIEINPLGLTPHGAVIVDAKMTIDDNALDRQKPLVDSLSAALAPDTASLSARASAAGFSFMPLPGDIALISMGAGFAMAVMDLVAEYGGSMANFIDTSGGVTQDKVQELAEIVLARAQEVSARAIIISFVITASSLKNVIEGIIAGLTRFPGHAPVFATFNAGAAATESLSYDNAVLRLESVGVSVNTVLSETVMAALASESPTAR